MYTVKVISNFSGAHNLRGYKGKCEELHGHNWKVEVEACAERIDDNGMVMDFKDLKKCLEEVISSLDHKYLNDVENFKTKNPTSENLAEYIYTCMSGKVAEAKIKAVTVWETDTSCATYGESR